jgi:hypothetical protein
MTQEGYCIENTGRIESIQQTASYVNQLGKKGNPEWLLNKGEGVTHPHKQDDDDQGANGAHPQSHIALNIKTVLNTKPRESEVYTTERHDFSL